MAVERIKVLVVEDDEVDYKAVARHLASIRHTSFDTVRARCYRDAIQALADNDFDIALVDYRLGDGQTGLDFVEEIGGREAAFPIILLTGLEDLQLDAKAAESGAYDYLDKFSLTRDLLDRAINFAIRSHSYELQLRDALGEANEQTQINRSLLAIVGHELRAPVSSLVSYSEYVLDNSDNTRAKDAAGKIQTTAINLQDFVRNLSEFVRLDSGAATINTERFDVAAMVKATTDLFAPYAKHKSIALETDLSGLGDGFIIGDELRIRQILVNLIKNAVTYSDGGVVQVLAVIDARGLAISVSDNGAGMNQNQIDSIMTGRRETLAASKDFDGGLGLGLTLCKKLLHLMNGRLNIKSAVGFGTTVSVKIPANRQAETRAA